MRAQRQHVAAQRRDRVRDIQRAQSLQQLTRRSHGARGRRVHEAQFAAAPGGQLECQSGQFHLRDLRTARRLETLRLRPQAITRALGNTSRAARALVGRRLRYGHGFQSGEATVGIEARLARQAAVDHHAHAGQGDARFGHVGRQHDASPALRVRRECERLLFQRQLAMQGQQLHLARLDLGQGRQDLLRIADLALPGQEDQYIAGMLGDRRFDAALELERQGLVAPCREVRHRHRKTAPGRTEPRCINQTRQRLAVQRRRHHHDAQVGAQLRLHVQRQRQAEVAAEVALVELVEDDRGHAVQAGIVLDHAGQDAFGQHFHASCRGGLVLEPDSITHALPDRFVVLPGHETRGRARGDAARLQHQDATVAAPRGLQHRQRHLRGLAGAGRRFEYQSRCAFQAAQDVRQQGGNREFGRGIGDIHP